MKHEIKTVSHHSKHNFITQYISLRCNAVNEFYQMIRMAAAGHVRGMLASVSFWPLLIIKLVARVIPARLIFRQMERQMRDKWNLLHHPRLTSGEKDESYDNVTD